MPNRPADPPDDAASPGKRWLARLSFVLAFIAIAVVLAIADWKSVIMFAVGLAAAVVSLTSAFLVLSRRGVLRWLALGVFARRRSRSWWFTRSPTCSGWRRSARRPGCWPA